MAKSESRSDLADWLSAKMRKQMWFSALGSIALLLLGILAIWLTFWITYGVLWFLSRTLVEVSAESIWYASAAFVGLLFVGNATTAREYLDHLELDLGPQRHIQLNLARATGYGWAMAFSDPKAARSTVKMITTLLYTGPRMLTAAWRLFARMLAARSMSTGDCGRILAMASQASKRTSFQEIAAKHPKMDHSLVFSQLWLIDGVVVLPSEPAGIALTPYLEDEILEWRKRQRKG